MATFPAHSSAVTCLQSHQLLLVQQTANDQRLISQTHTALTVPGYGSLTSSSETPTSDSSANRCTPSASRPRAGWTCHIQEWTGRDPPAQTHVVPIHANVTLPVFSLSLRGLPCQVRRWPQTVDILIAVPGTRCRD